MGTPTTPQPRFGWIFCGSCGGSGITRHYRGNSATVNHLLRGGDPTRLPCGDCHGAGRSWGMLPNPVAPTAGNSQ